jgi:hypothetical protein
MWDKLRDLLQEPNVVGDFVTVKSISIKGTGKVDDVDL